MPNCQARESEPGFFLICPSGQLGRCLLEVTKNWTSPLAVTTWIFLLKKFASKFSPSSEFLFLKTQFFEVMTAHILVTTSNELGMRNCFKKTWLRSLHRSSIVRCVCALPDCKAWALWEWTGRKKDLKGQSYSISERARGETNFVRNEHKKCIFSPTMQVPDHFFIYKEWLKAFIPWTFIFWSGVWSSKCQKISFWHFSH